MCLLYTFAFWFSFTYLWRRITYASALYSTVKPPAAYSNTGEELLWRTEADEKPVTYLRQDDSYSMVYNWQAKALDGNIITSAFICLLRPYVCADCKKCQSILWHRKRFRLIYSEYLELPFNLTCIFEPKEVCRKRMYIKPNREEQARFQPKNITLWCICANQAALIEVFFYLNSKSPLNCSMNVAIKLICWSIKFIALLLGTIWLEGAGEDR